MRRVLQRAAEAGVLGAIWTGGGEPTVSPLLAMGLRCAAGFGMVSGLYTNGIQIGLLGDLALELLDPACKLAFIRLSLNTATPEVAKRFAGASPQDLEAQWAALKRLAVIRTALRGRYEAAGVVPPSLQVSTIVDHRNLGDLEKICHRVAEAVAGRGLYPQESDALIVRPLTRTALNGYRLDDHDDSVIQRILDVAGRAGSARAAVEEAGFRVYFGFGLDRVDSGEFATYGELLRAEYESRDCCWANGLFLTVGPDGSAYLCVDRNCDDEWKIGSLLEHTVDELYRGPRRCELLERVHRERCGPGVCEATCRVPRLNRIARALMCNQLTEDDVARFREVAKRDPPLLLS